MSGLQELAAIIGITEAAFRSISSLYNFIKDLQNAPHEIQTLQDETASLNQSLFTLLKALTSVDIDIQKIASDIGLPNAIHRCGKACARLQNKLHAWAQSGSQAWLARLHFRRHKKDIESVVAEINAAKQTAILTVVITQLSIELLRGASEKEKIALIEGARARIGRLKMSEKPRSNESRSLGSAGHGCNPKTQERESGARDVEQSYQNADKHIDIQAERTEQKGDDNVMGIKKKGYDGGVRLRMNDAKQEGNNNLIGLDA